MKTIELIHSKWRYLFIVVLLSGCSVDIDPSIANTDFGMHAIKYEYIIAMTSLIGGFACIIAGIILTVLGFTGSIEWIVEAAGFTSRLVNASPGIFLILIGFFLSHKGRIKIISQKKSQQNKE